MTIEPFTAKRGEILAMGAIVQQYSPSETRRAGFVQWKLSRGKIRPAEAAARQGSPSETRRAWRDPFSGIAEHAEIRPAEAAGGVARFVRHA